MEPSLPDLPPPLDLPPTKPVIADIPQNRKAAILVRLLLGEGVNLSLTGLPETMQVELAEQIGALHLVKRDTIRAVAAEFLKELSAVGMASSGGIEAALSVLDGAISQGTSQRMRREIGLKAISDPWERLEGLDTEKLLPIMERESVEIGAVILSKLRTARSAELLAALPGEKARKIAFAMSLTGSVTPDAVDRIGISLANQLDAEPPAAFAVGPVERVGEILNFSPATTRDDVLGSLEESDADFASLVRQAIFTFADIPDRLNKTDVPKVIRGIDQDVLVLALAGARQTGLESAAEFILGNMSKRMAEQLTEEIAERGTVKTADGESAMTAIIAAIRELDIAGEIELIIPDDTASE